MCSGHKGLFSKTMNDSWRSTINIYRRNCFEARTLHLRFSNFLWITRVLVELRRPHVVQASESRQRLLLWRVLQNFSIEVNHDAIWTLVSDLHRHSSMRLAVIKYCHIWSAKCICTMPNSHQYKYLDESAVITINLLQTQVPDILY